VNDRRPLGIVVVKLDDDLHAHSHAASLALLSCASCTN
jgi:hypothetical protein